MAKLLTLDAWLKAVDRKAIDNSPGFSPQCTDLWRDYLMRVVGAPWGAGHAQSYAWQLWTMFEKDVDQPSRWLSKVPASSTALPGDGAVWGTGLYDPTGHVAVVMADLGDRLRVMNQNYAGHPYTEISTISKKHVLGYLRPKTKALSPGESGGDEGDEMSAEFEKWARTRLDEISDMLTFTPTGDPYMRALDNKLTAVEKVGKETRDALLKPDQNGFRPVDVILSHTVGAYAIVAKQAKAQGVTLDTSAIVGELRKTLPNDVADELAKRLTNG